MIAKYIIPVIAVLAFGGGTFFGGKVLAPKPDKINYDKIRAMISEEVRKIPKPQQGSAIDIEKLKGFKGTFAIHQHTHIEANGDSLILDNFRKELQALKLARCK